jgi:glycerate dehydrogenase
MKIVVLDSSTLGDDISLDVLSTHGDVIEYKSTDSTQLPHRCAEADVLVLNKVKINEAVFAAAPNLKLICVTATGYDNIDLCAARKHGVAVANVPGYSTDSVALFTVATVLSLVTHLREYNEYVTSGEYTRSGIANRLSPVYHEIRGLTWGIIGYGNIGRAVADVARALGARLPISLQQTVLPMLKQKQAGHL